MTVKVDVGQTRAEGVNEELCETLRRLRGDPTAAIELYEQLFRGKFWAIVADPSVPINGMSFLTYPSSGGVRELPVFTQSARTLAKQIAADPTNPMPIELTGESFWPRMLDIVQTGQIEVAVDPGEQHGIRLNREMILGMVGKYGQHNVSQ